MAIRSINTLFVGTIGALTATMVAGITIGSYRLATTEVIEKGGKQYYMCQNSDSIKIWDGGYKFTADTNAVLQTVDYFQTLGRFGTRRVIRKPNQDDQKLFRELITTYIADKKRDQIKLENLEKAISDQQ